MLSPQRHRLSRARRVQEGMWTAEVERQLSVEDGLVPGYMCFSTMCPRFQQKAPTGMERVDVPYGSPALLAGPRVLQGNAVVKLQPTH